MPAASKTVVFNDARSEASGTVELLIGDEVLKLLSDESFLAEWDGLFQNCPWATVFQSKEFVGSWYTIYHKKHLPLIIKSVCEGKLNGLLTLGKLESGEISGAGGKHAEYQTWLSSSQNGEIFISNALKAVRRQFPKCNVKLKFIPKGTPLAWIEKNKYWRKSCVLRAFEQPLLNIDNESIIKELRKKNRREKINRLKRIGNLRLERVEKFDSFLSALKEVIPQYDFRNGAKYNKIPSEDDPLRNELIIELFKKKVLHATILKLNDEIIASSIIATSNNWLHLWGVTSYAPQYAKYSPSILHYLMLGQLMVEEGFEVLDLTPGDDPYKKELATGNDIAYELIVAGSILSYTQSSIINLIWERLAKTNLNRKILKDKVVKAIYLAKNKGITPYVSGLMPKSRLDQESFILLPIQASFTKSAATTKIPINKNSLNDLICYAASKGKCTRWEFLENAMKRLETGQHAYTLVHSNKLMICVWVSKRELKHLLNNNPSASSQQNQGTVLQNLYIHPDAKEKLFPFLTTVIYEESRREENSQVYLCTNNLDTAITQTIENMKFNLSPHIA